MSNTNLSMRRISVASAVLASVLSATAMTTTAADATVARSSSVSQCSQTYVPVGTDRRFRTWFFGKTTIRIRNAGNSSWAFVQWWDDAGDSGELDIAPGATADLIRGFVGFSVTLHPWYSNGVYASLPYGPC
jgi:hypothetical protein